MAKGSEPIRSILIDAPGVPGHRTFYLQARLSDGDLITILLEKAQAMIIVDQIDALLKHRTHTDPALSTVPAVSAAMVVPVGDAPVLHLSDPVLFRAGQIALQYEPESDLVSFQVSELWGVGQGAPQVCRWWITRQQLGAFGEQTRRVIGSVPNRGFAAGLSGAF